MNSFQPSIVGLNEFIDAISYYIITEVFKPRAFAYNTC